MVYSMVSTIGVAFSKLFCSLSFSSSPIILVKCQNGHTSLFRHADMAYVQGSSAQSIIGQLGSYPPDHWLGKTSLARSATVAPTKTGGHAATSAASGVALPTPSMDHPFAADKSRRKRISARNPDGCKSFENGEQSGPEDVDDENDDGDVGDDGDKKKKGEGEGETEGVVSSQANAGDVSVTSSPASKTPKRSSGLVDSAAAGATTPAWPGKKIPAKPSSAVLQLIENDNDKTGNADNVADDGESDIVESTQQDGRVADSETVKATRRRRLQRQKPVPLRFPADENFGEDPEKTEHGESLAGLTQSPDLFLK